MADPYVGAARAVLGQGLAMGWGDEAEAWLRSKVGQGSYEDNLRKIRGEYSEYSKENPFLSGTLEFAGGAAPAVGAMLIPGGQPAGVSRLSALAARYLPGAGKIFGAGVAPEAVGIGQSMARGAGMGSAVGTVSGAGAATEGERGGGALGGGIGGATIGAVIPPAAKVLGTAGRVGLERLIPTEGRVTSAAERKLNKALTESNMSPRDLEMSMMLDRYLGVPTTVANVSPSVSNLAEAVAQRTGRGAERIERELTAQKAGSRERVMENIKSSLNPSSYYDEEQRLVGQLRRNAGKVYDDAYAVGEVNDPIINEVLKVPAFKTFFEKARSIADMEATAAKLRGEDPSAYALKQVYDLKSLHADPTTGKLTLDVTQVPDVRTLDYIKRGIDATISSGFEGKGMSTAEASALRDLRKSFIERLDQVVPEYKKARAQYRGDLEVVDALRAARDDFNKLDHEQIAHMVKQMSPAELDAFRTGASRHLYETVMNPSQDFNAAKRIINSPETRDKLRPMFDNQGEFDLFRAAMEREAEIFNQANKVLGGSQTGKRMQMREEFEGDTGVAQALQQMSRGGFSAGLMSLVGRALSKGSMNEATASKLADMLMSSDPTAVATVVKALEKQAEFGARATKGFKAGEAGTITGTTSAAWTPTEAAAEEPAE